MADPKQNRDELLERLLDDQLAGDELSRAQEAVDADPELAKQVALQGRIDESLRRLFQPPAGAPAGALRDQPASHVRPHDEGLGSDKPTRGRMRMFGLALAASVAWIVVIGQLFFTGDDRAEYGVRDLALVYQETVDQGFEPLWVCEDDKQFAETFQTRQGTPLVLSDMPVGREMVGLSYLGGLARNATSMLARVDGKPVIVFVARAENDPRPSTGRQSDSGLYVHRVEKLGLVFYEVSPLDEPLVAPFFEQADLAELP